MKKEFSEKPENFSEKWEGQMKWFSWQDFLAAIPTPIFLATTYKSNGKENASLQSWSTFSGQGGEYICLMGSVSKYGHFYQSLKETGCCVLNFPAADIYDKCLLTIKNNDFEKDEITVSGLTAEKASKVNAPRVKECFLNIECRFLWEHDQFENSPNAVIALKTVNVAMDSEYYDENKLGRYGKTGYIYNIRSPQNPDTGEETDGGIGTIEVIRV